MSSHATSKRNQHGLALQSPSTSPAHTWGTNLLWSHSYPDFLFSKIETGFLFLPCKECHLVFTGLPHPHSDCKARHQPCRHTTGSRQGSMPPPQEAPSQGKKKSSVVGRLISKCKPLTYCTSLSPLNITSLHVCHTLLSHLWSSLVGEGSWLVYH